MPFRFNSCHLKNFFQITESVVYPYVRVPKTWAASVSDRLQDQSCKGAIAKATENLPDFKPCRTFLKAQCEDQKIDDLTCFLSIMAWGGMRISNGEKVLPKWDQIQPTMKKLRAGCIDRGQAYTEFCNFRKNNPGSGMGPAFFTKLIFFAHPSHDGYIMDQWTSRSINLLIDSPKPLVRLAPYIQQKATYSRVVDLNDADTYQAYCRAVEQLAKIAVKDGQAITPEIVEERLFSRGGRPAQRGRWRQYLLDNE